MAGMVNQRCSLGGVLAGKAYSGVGVSQQAAKAGGALQQPLSLPSQPPRQLFLLLLLCV